MKFKKVLLLIALLLFTLVGCGKTTTKPTPTPTPTPAPAPDPTPSPTPDAEYSVKFYDGTKLLSELAVKQNKNVTLPTDPKKDGFNFVGWFSDSKLTTKFDANKKITENTNVYAKFEIIKYSVKFYDETKLLSEQEVEIHKKAVLPSEPKKEGFKFIGWFSDSSLTKKFDENLEIKENTNVYAKFEVILHTVRFYDGTNLLGERKVQETKTVDLLESVEKEEFNFVGWFSDSSLENKYDPKKKIMEDTNIYAKYLNHKDYFLFARTNTVEGDTFKYNYSLAFTNVVENKIKKIPLPGAFFDGTSYYNKNSTISFLKDEITSGALVKDHHNFHFIKDGNLHKVTYKHNKKTGEDKNPTENIVNNYKEKYESSVYAKALFKYDADKIQSVVKNGSVYELTFNESQIEIIKEFLIEYGQNKIAEKLKQENFKYIKVAVQINNKTHKITKFNYSFEFQQDFDQKVGLVQVKGTLVSKLDYAIVFDHGFSGIIPIDNKIKNYI